LILCLPEKTCTLLEKNQSGQIFWRDLEKKTFFDFPGGKQYFFSENYILFISLLITPNAKISNSAIAREIRSRLLEHTIWYNTGNSPSVGKVFRFFRVARPVSVLLIDISWVDWAYKSATCAVMYCRQRRHLYYGGQIYKYYLSPSTAALPA
jgi:hypothetical protein